MNILHVNETPKVQYNLDGHILCSLPGVEVVHLSLKPGEKIDKHINPNDVIFFVVEGTAMLQTDTEEEPVTKDQVIVVPGGTNRGIDNKSESIFKVLVIKTKTL